jgi:hypothetical protein
MPSSSAEAARAEPEAGSPVAFWVFIGAVAVIAITWWAGISLRVGLFGVDLDSVRASGIRRELPGTMGQYLLMLFLTALMGGAYLVAAWAASKRFQAAFPIAIGGCILVTLAVLPQMPLVSPDTTHFAADVRTFWLNGNYPTTKAGVPNRQCDKPTNNKEQPCPPGELDPVAREVRVYRDKSSGYGPVTYIVGGLPIPFVGEGLRANVLGEKVLSGTLLIVIALLAGFIARALGRNPAVPVALIGLNPLMLLEFPGDGHNDTIMVTFAMLAFLAAVALPGWRGRFATAGALLVSVLSKFAMLAPSPIIGAYWFPRWRVYLAAAFFVLATLFVIVFEVSDSFGTGNPGPLVGITDNTPYQIAIDIFDLKKDARRGLVIASYIVLFAITAAIMARHRLEEREDLIAAVALQMALFLFLCAPTLRHWYQLWAFPFIILSGRRWLTAGGIAFTFGALFQVWTRQWGDVIATKLNIDNAQDWAVVVMWIGALAAAIATWRLDKRPPKTLAVAGGQRAARRRAQTRAQRRRAFRASLEPS